MSFPFPPARLRVVLAGSALALIAACEQPLDFDLRGGFGNGNTLDTAQAARSATAARPAPDARGIISYPNYQVAVARRGDTLASLAARIGADAGALARYNGIQTGDSLRAGEIIALPNRVAEPAGGPIRPAPGGVDITSLAGSAIDRADAQRIETTALEPSQPSGIEPIRHKVERGETAYTIARLYGVSVRSLAEWNGLGSDFAVREGQYLLIPVALPDEAAAETETRTAALTEPPGTGTPTPTPPSSTRPLPAEQTEPAAAAAPKPDAPDLGGTETKTASNARMSFPVTGKIVREYVKGKNDGIDIAASPGTPVKAAAAGIVAAITEDTNDIPIIVVKHPDNLLTVYSNVGNLSVKKGDTVGRGQKLAEIRSDGAAAVHFEVRKGFDSVDPLPYLQ